MRKIKNIKFLIAGVGLVIIVILSTTCLKQQHTDMRETTGEALQYRINQFVYGGWNFRVGETLAEIITNLGTPQSFKTEKVKNTHNPDQIDEVYELLYDGLFIEIYKVTETNKEFVTALSVTDDKYKMKWGLNIGSSRNQVKNVLGNPSEEKNNVYIYKTDEAPSYVSFYFRNGTMYKIYWSFYID